MSCPPAIAEIVLDILYHGILSARAAGWQGEAEAAALEADHIHNLPALLKNYQPQLLEYYWNAERPSFIQGCARTGISPNNFNALWDRLLEAMRQVPELSWAK